MHAPFNPEESPTILTADEEKELERACRVLQESGFPLTKELVSGLSRISWVM